MNKKNLSVVLAGAMLATTVAPVLAETTVSKEYTTEELALLAKEIEAKMNEEKISKYDVFTNDTTGKFVSNDVKTLMGKAESVYGIKVVGEDGKDKTLTKIDASVSNAVTTYESKVTDNVTYSIADVKEILDESNISKLAGCTIQLVKLSTTNFKGQVIPGTEIKKVEGTEENYEPRADFIVADSADADGKALKNSVGIGADVNAATTASNGYVASVVGVGKKYDITTGNENDSVTAATSNDYFKEVKLTTKVPTNVADPSNNPVEIYLDSTKKKLDFTLPLDSKGNLLDAKKAVGTNTFAGFETKSEWKASKLVEEAPANVASYKINAVSNDENTYKASDLYDGVVLTAKGTELAAELANAKANTSDGTDSKALVKISAFNDTDASLYKFYIYYYKNEDLANADTTLNGTGAYKTITVYSSNKDEMSSLYGMLSNTGSYEVGIVGGANRYETAVNVSKAQGIKAFEKASAGNIVLVNGLSLVDGLAAAPLAAEKSAPVLLSKADSLPESTKAYIKDELLSKKSTKAEKKQVTVHLVGGNSVLSNNLVSELEDMGLTVVRYGGANREATSLKVAEALKANGNNAFVVGGNGEADAMAISAVAASTKTPIIVSNVNGLSKNALTYINENLAKGDITVVGGESVVSKAEEEAINESLTLNKASRIAGANRFETNAKIIEKYYKSLGTDETNSATNNKGVKAIIVAKDGQSNKGDLVDALAAANFAAANNAPIVLATNSLNAVQKNALLKVDKTEGTDSAVVNSLEKAVQVGEGVERSVLEAVAGLFGLSNK
ncbi:cell wall-binding repeat-containing protein [Peptacetobacter hiranonis]|uniref:cell wall-binding repeat-containing protein n=1 Tax=Peptacetobacter hiranonis TaxID=89152 RepID=UPI0022E21CF7|nr:cell wall-binding repeat-containing protein [Peptacetobacter hiranonis]